jgi:ubiquinone/menaquinone biosynthesis C-methylase UbiE
MAKDPAVAVSDSNDVHERVTSQFGAAAGAYTKSVGHSDPEMLKRVVELARPRLQDLALDIATGAGHTALALAPHVAQVVAYDLTPQMLEQVARNAAARGLANVVTRQGAAESLPFEDSAFDIVTVRQAPHHFADINAAIRELARVLKPGGRAVIVDSCAPEDEALDRAWNEIEKLRDPSHVRNYRPSQWRAMVERAGLRITSTGVDYYTEQGRAMNFDTWTERMRTPAEAIATLRTIFHQASPALRDALRIEVRGDSIGFCVPQVTIAADKM